MKQFRLNPPQQGINVLKRFAFNSGPAPRHTALYLAISILVAPSMVRAQAVPDAGGILESNRPPALIAPPAIGSKVLPDVKVAPAAPMRGEQRVLVKGFAFKGVSAFPESALLALLAPHAGRALTFDELNQAAKAVSDHYHRHGYFLASAYLLPQGGADGTVVIQVLEGRISSVALVPDATVRLHADVARRYLDALVTPGAPLKEKDLERALLLIRDLPGVTPRAELSPGARLGETAIDVGLSEGALFNGNVGLDNSSNRYTGRGRLSGGLNANDVAGLGGQLSLLAMSSGSDFNYGRIGYVMPVGGYGTLVGAAYSSLGYHLGADFAPLDAHGNATVAQVIVTQPLIRSSYTDLMFRTGYDDKRYTNRANGAATSAKHVSNLPLGLSLVRQDSLFGAGITTAVLDLTLGEVDLAANAAYQNADLAGPQTDGGFVRANYQFSRLQTLGADWSILANIGGQLASKNLESGEKLSLGGPGRVRGYPAGEASGDAGYVLTLEARHKMPSLKLEATAFYDFGHVTLNRHVYAGALLAVNLFLVSPFG